MKKILKPIILIFILLFSVSNINFASNSDIENIKEETVDRTLYDEKELYLKDENNSFEDRVYSDYNVDMSTFEQLTEAFLLSIYENDMSLIEQSKIYDSIGLTKTSKFIKQLNDVSYDSIPKISKNESFLHNGKCETRTILTFENGNSITINLSYNKKIPYYYFINNIGFYPSQLSFDNTNEGVIPFDDYCISKGINLNQYADYDDFIRNFIIVIVFIVLLILFINYQTKKQKNTHNVLNDTNSTDIKTNIDDTSLVAILTAAIAAYEGTSENNIRIKTIKKNYRWRSL